MSTILSLQALDAAQDDAAVPYSHWSTDVHLPVGAPVEAAE
ncbi:hypothetical protein [Kitasatospora sp. NPDC018619]